MDSNKEIALSFLRMSTSGSIDEAYGKYVSSNFHHHNPYFHDDAASLKEGMKDNKKRFPNKIYKVIQALEDGDLVAVHGLVKLSEKMQIAVVHILRFENGKIVEMWDIGQQIPNDAVNSML